MHIKRKASPKIWPITRKGTKYIVVPLQKGLPLLVALRDMLKVAENKKEAKKIIHEKNVYINGKLIMDEKFALNLFDVLKLKDKFYRLVIENKKYSLNEISEKDAKTKIAKIIDKRLYKGKRQANLSDGRNYLVKEQFNVGDSAVIDFEENKITDIIPLKEKSKVFISTGKHIGKIGVIEKISNDLAEIKLDKEKINVNLHSLIALK